MFDFNFIEEVWHTLSKNKLRSFLTSIGVFWAILFLILMIGFGMGVKSGFMEQIDDFSNSAYISLQRTSIPHNGYPDNRQLTLSKSDINGIRHNTPGITESSVISKTINLPVTYKNRSINFAEITSYTDELAELNTLNVYEGRMLSELDRRTRRLVCVVGEQVRDNLFGEDVNCEGEFIFIQGVQFEIIGVVRSGSISSSNVYLSIYVPNTVATELFQMRDDVKTIFITAEKGEDVGEVAEGVVRSLKNKKMVAEHDDKAFHIEDISKYFVTFYSFTIGIEILIWIVGLGTLLAGIIGVSSIMLITLKERTSEIGVRRALGAKPFDIILQIMIESFFLTFTTGVFALGSGVLILSVLDEPIREATDGMIELGLDFRLAIIASVIVLGSSILAGCIPAMRAVKIRAVDAIREE